MLDQIVDRPSEIEDEELLVASQYRLMWWRFKRHKPAMISSLILLAFYIATRFDFEEYLKVLFIGLSILALFSIIAIIIRPDQAIHHNLHEGGWRGIYFHKNGFAQEMLILALLSFTIKNKKLFTKVVIKIGGLLFVLFVVKSISITSTIVSFCPTMIDL